MKRCICSRRSALGSTTRRFERPGAKALVPDTDSAVNTTRPRPQSVDVRGGLQMDSDVGSDRILEIQMYVDKRLRLADEVIGSR